MTLRGLWNLTWIEIKVFLREPLGAIGTIGVPVLLFAVLGRVTNHRLRPPSFPSSGLSGGGLPVLVSLLIAVSAVLSLVTIISSNYSALLRAQLCINSSGLPGRV